MATVEKRIIDISPLAIIKIVLVLLLVVFLYIIKDIIILLLISIVFASALDLLVNKLKTKKIPRWLVVIFIYIVLIAIIALIISLVVPPIASQSKDLIKNSPNYLNHLSEQFPSFENFISKIKISEDLMAGLSTGGIFKTTTGFFSGIVYLIAALAISFYIVVLEDGVKKFIRLIIPRSKQEYAVELLKRIQKKIGRWVWGQLALMFIVFLADYIGLLILGIKNALILALIAGVLEIIPFIGPIMSAVPAMIIGYIQSPWLGLFGVPVLYFLIQQAENHIFTPKIMGKAIGVNPLAIILGILIGGKLAGLTGAILAVPVIAGFSVLVEDWWEVKKEQQENKITKKV